MRSDPDEVPIPLHVLEEAEALTHAEREALRERFLALTSLETVTLQQRLTMLRLLDAAKAWEGWPNCAEWLSFKTSLSIVTARAHLRIARQLAYLPIVDAAFACGELSYSKVRLLCGVLKPEVTDPKYERRLVSQARAFNTEQLRRVLGCARNALADGPAAAAERERRTCFRVEQLSGGMSRIQCDLPSDVAARVVGVVEQAMEDLVKQRSPVGAADELAATIEELKAESSAAAKSPTPAIAQPSRLEEASARGGRSTIAEIPVKGASAKGTSTSASGAGASGTSASGAGASGAGADGTSASVTGAGGMSAGGSGAGDEDGVVVGSASDPTGCNGPRRVGDPAGSPWVAGLRPSVGMADGFVAVFEHYAAHRTCSQPGKPGEVLLTVSTESLTGTMANRCRLGPALVHQWTCDAVVQPVLVDARGDVLDVGRRHRVVPPRLRRALGLRDGEACQFPGCGARALLEAHHLKPWLEGGETKIDNLALICRRHHRFLHQADFSVELTAEGLVFRDPSGRVLALPELPALQNPRSELDLLLREARFAPGGLECQDGKTNYDLSLAVGGVVHSVQRAHMKGPLAPDDHFSHFSSPPSWLPPHPESSLAGEAARVGVPESAYPGSPGAGSPGVSLSWR